MKRFLILILCFASLPAFARIQPVELNRKNAYRGSAEKWLYYPGDHPAMAMPAYNDTGWKEVHTRLRMSDSIIASSFKGICWFRLTVRLDSSMSNRAWALSIKQAGASEIWLDGRLLKKIGIIAGKDSTEYEDPNDEPFVFVMGDTGLHVLAIRYANYKAATDFARHYEDDAGMYITLATANSTVPNKISNVFFISAVSMLLFGIFLALAFMHLLLFLYHRNDLSNLYFAGFSLGFSMIMLFLLLGEVSSDRSFDQKAEHIVLFSVTLMGTSLAGFMIELFGRRKKRFRIVIGIACLSAILPFIDFKLGAGFTMGFFIYATFDAMLLLIRGVIKRAEGAHIMGFGFFLFLAMTLITILLSIIFKNQLSVSTSNFGGQVWLFLVALSILSMPISFSVFLASRFAKVNRNLQLQLTQVQMLSEKTIEQEAEKQKLLENRKAELEEEVDLRTREVVQQKNEIEQQHNELKEAKKKSDDLLLNILPAEIAEELKEKGRSEARLYNDVSVLFTDFVDFTIISEELSPSALVAEIDHCFKAFDEIISQFGLEKIKTIGDAYLAVCGLPIENENHATAALEAALAIRDFMVARRQEHNHTFEVRLGVHSGSVVAGIVGLKKFAYDIWGDTVNTAARMEQSGEAGKVNISGATYQLIQQQFKVTYRGELEAKNKGRMSMYFVEEKIV